MTTDHADATAEQMTADSPATDEVSPTPDVAAEETGPLVALEIDGGWVLGREGESETEHRKRAVFNDGSVRTYRNRPGTVRSVTPGSMLHRLVEAPEVMKKRMDESPAEVVVELLAEVRTPLSKKEIEAKLDDLRLLPEEGWWAAVTKQLKLNPRVVVAGGRYSLRRED
jgi:hypothetical protein